MKSQALFLLVLADFSFAAQYSVDSTCRSDDALFNGVKGAIQEGIDLADNALTVMADHADDKWVEKMAKYILGADGYDDKFLQAKDSFAHVKAYEREPSQLEPQDASWKSARSNADVEIYCGSSRFTKEEGKVLWTDQAMQRSILSLEKAAIDQCYRTDFVLGSGDKAPKAMTKSSDRPNLKEYLKAKETDPNAKRSDYTAEYPGIACSMDICTWFTTRAALDGWPIINADRVDKCKTDEFKAGLKDETPADGLKTIGSTMLHELTHTNQGGKLIDVPEDQRPDDVKSCYGWLCIGGLKNERNADSIAMLGIAMQVWSLGHYIEEDGDDKHDGYERGTTHNFTSDGRWAGRLRSSWGPHWECEEVAMGEYSRNLKRRFHYHAFSLLVVCKKTFLDVRDFMAEKTAFNFTDVETLDLVLQKSDEASGRSNHLWNFWDYARLNVRKINIALRLPVGFYKTLESETAISTADQHMNAASTACTTWATLWPAVCQCQQLRSLCIWLDHDNEYSWSVVKERLALRHITAALSERSQAHPREGLPRIDILVNLPNLHPGIARLDTHFTQDGPPLPFTIERRIRQRYHCEERAGGNLAVQYKADFPVMHELVELLEGPTMTLQELERLERRLWENGTNVGQLVTDVAGVGAWHDTFEA
ncbi:hypothetical protein O1611_g1036 [Lasiodiplodia mahajangana]|uniref:Uncharacterized protein n=1 Tax=Lasiodiplodia mahajangana TaxID=1108764 RepID=A0ACC2JYN0_9PEZI|nr:hypothetical protein O1611_g1036 [Lasiodiplodia mahajangana]